MKITEVKTIYKYFFDLKIIGMGTTAICFLTKDNKVLKLYYNSFNKNENILNQMELLNEISNDTLIGPEELLINDKGEIIGYLYDYINAKTLSSTKNSLVIGEIINMYDKLKNDIKVASDKKFILGDLHSKNILINSLFYIIDLDRGYIKDDYTKEEIFSLNMKKINKEIIYALFNVRYDKLISFYNIDIENLYHNISNPNSFLELLYTFKEKCYPKIDNTSNLKKYLSYAITDNSYYKYF
jgi:hypothetical protein